MTNCTKQFSIIWSMRWPSNVGLFQKINVKMFDKSWSDQIFHCWFQHSNKGAFLGILSWVLQKNCSNKIPCRLGDQKFQYYNRSSIMVKQYVIILYFTLSWDHECMAEQNLKRLSISKLWQAEAWTEKVT